MRNNGSFYVSMRPNWTTVRGCGGASVENDSTDLSWVKAMIMRAAESTKVGIKSISVRYRDDY